MVGATRRVARYRAARRAAPTLLLSGTSQGQDVDPICPGFEENFGAFLDRRPGCEDVVDQEDGFLGYGVDPENGEGPSDIFLSFRRGKLGLRRGGAEAPQGCKI
jgi:hypothetical protein